MPCRSMTGFDADFAIACAVPADAPGLTIVARPAGMPGEAAAKFSALRPVGRCGDLRSRVRSA
ncbi:MAG: hypothetical protein ACREV0_12740 [Burkholderiales bacterium]